MAVARRSAEAATTATTLPPLDSATRRPASAVTSSSLPTTAIRSPPPALEQASTSAAAARASCATSGARQASYPSRTSVLDRRRVGRGGDDPALRRSTSAALVKVEPKSTQTTRSTWPGLVAASAAGQPRARSRSAIRSSAVSMPTLSRTRSAGHLEVGAGDAGVGHPAGVLDERLDAAEGLAEGEDLGLLADRERLLLAAGDPERHHAAEALHLPRGDRVPGVLREAGVDHLRDRRVAGEELDDPLGVVAVPVHPDRQRLEAAVGEERVERARPPRPWRSGGRRSCSASSRSRTTSAPPTTSEWPPKYLVVEWTTTSAPRVSGCWRYGDAKVLSTTSSAPASWATRGQRLDVADVEQRVGGRLDPDQLGLAGPDRGADGVDVGDRRRAVLQAPDLLDLVEEPEACRRTRRRG